ncbi:hypothetical protein KKF86_00385, partial [bacterium]|nr:hypothetical protein [bacterium]
VILKDSSATDIQLESSSVDGIITSPPYSFAIDYVKNDQAQLEYLGYNVQELKSQMIGLKGKNRDERLSIYFETMAEVCKEIYRVLKKGKIFVMIIGSNTNQTGGIRLEKTVIDNCENVGLSLVKSILKPIKGMRNTMKDEYVLFFKKILERYMMSSNRKKLQTVIDKNTFYFFNAEFEEKYEGYISSLKETLLVLKNDIEINGLRKESFEKLINEKQNGLRALLSLTGFSNEFLKRITTIIRVVDDGELNKLVNKSDWFDPREITDEGVKEWSDNKIQKMISNNIYFRRGIVNLFFEGATIPFLCKTIPLFELKKLSISKLRFEIPEMIDTLIRYKEKGSYSGKKENNPEILIEKILDGFGIPYEKGDLSELIENAPETKRTMDFIIPNKKAPLIIAECSFLATTSSGQGDKSKTEISVDSLIKKHYPKAKFIGFVDGVGWYVRKGDLKRMVSAYSEVFTFHEDELNRFKNFLMEVFEK